MLQLAHNLAIGRLAHIERGRHHPAQRQRCARKGGRHGRAYRLQRCRRLRQGLISGHVVIGRSVDQAHIACMHPAVFANAIPLCAGNRRFLVDGNEGAVAQRADRRVIVEDARTCAHIKHTRNYSALLLASGRWGWWWRWGWRRLRAASIQQFATQRRRDDDSHRRSGDPVECARLVPDLAVGGHFLANGNISARRQAARNAAPGGGVGARPCPVGTCIAKGQPRRRSVDDHGHFNVGQWHAHVCGRLLHIRRRGESLLRLRIGNLD